MRILVVADTVVVKLLEKEEGRPFLSNIDLVLGCGDLPPEYLSDLRSRYDVPLYYILGNHDIRFDNAPPAGCRMIDRHLVVQDGLRILGFSGSRWYNGKINQYTEREMSLHVRKMWFQLWRHRGVDLVITHAPPRYINDQEDRCHKGFHAFRRLIQRHAPPYFLHGHIHKHFDDNSDRISTFDSTSVINCYGYFILEINSV